MARGLLTSPVSARHSYGSEVYYRKCSHYINPFSFTNYCEFYLVLAMCAN